MIKIEGLVGRTLRARPSGVGPAMASAARAGFLRPSAGGWAILPLGLRVLDRMADVLLEGLGCQEVGFMADGEEALGPALADLLKGETQSYRQLPLRIVTQLRGAGSTHANVRQVLGVAGAFADEDGLTGFRQQSEANHKRLAGSARLTVLSAADAGGSSALMVIGPNGRNVALRCEACGSTYVREAAPFAREQLPAGADRSLERVHTPGASTIQTLAEMLGTDRERTLKALFVATEEGELVFALVRGDLEASLEKLTSVLGGRRLRPATDSEITAAGAVPGFAGPIGMRVRRAGQREGVRVIADASVFTGNDFAVGANADDYHYIHIDPRRDFEVTEQADIALPPLDAGCAVCGNALMGQRGTIVARWIPLRAPSFTDQDGSERSAAAAWMETDLLALFEQVASACTDDAGIAWPSLLAPADIHIVDLKEPEASLDAASALERKGLSVLLDDRPIGAGAKFADADLIGCPVRVTISARSLQAGGAEVAGRSGVSPAIVRFAELADHVSARLAALMST